LISDIIAEGKDKVIEKFGLTEKMAERLIEYFKDKNKLFELDQPEEDLDNRFIYEDIVNILRNLKSKRQIITATHNANIPVVGDSELIIVLDKQEEKCQIVDMGSIDKESIKEQVKRIMEGGEEAFKRRAEKYGGI